MNIGIVTTWFERGAAYVSRAYMNVLSKDNDVFIYARGGEAQARGNPTWDIPNVTWSPVLHGFFIDSTEAISRFHFLRWLRNNRIDIVFFNEQAYIQIVKEVSELGYKTGSYIDYYTEDTVPDFDIFDFLICNTKRHYSVFKEHRRCLYIPWGTNIDVFYPNAARPLSNDDIVFFHSAGLAHAASIRKGTDLLIQSFLRVTGNARLVIHSQVALNQYGDDVMNMVSSDPRIEFIKKSVSAPGLFFLGDVYVYPTRLEGIGLTIAEALASGLPVITTDDMPMNEFVRDQYNGLLVKVSNRHRRSDGYYWPLSIVDIPDLTEKMQAYVDDRQLVAVHSVNARTSAEQLFNWEKNTKDLSGWFSKIPTGNVCHRIGFNRFLRWCLFDAFLFAQGYISRAVKACITSEKTRKVLKRIL